MEFDPYALHQTQRIRYEAFSKFATELNNCADYNAVSRILSSQVKFIFDCFIFRIYYRNQSSRLFFHGFKGKDTFFQNGGKLYDFEIKVIEKGLPVTLSAEEGVFNNMIADTLFAHEKVRAISSLPVSYPEGHEILITIASKETRRSVELDFKFLKLVADLLSNKLYQLILLEDIAGQNQDLAVKNKQITSLNKYLEDAVSRRTAELRDTNKELSTLFYRSAHDFRAPLANIMGLANAAALITDDEEVLALFEMCRKVVNGMDGMLAKLDYLGTVDLLEKTEEVSLANVFSDLEEKFKDRLSVCGCKLSVSIGKLKSYRSNSGILFNIFEHLLDNALTYHDGEPQINIEAADAGEHIEIKFTDNGRGIHPFVLPRIFDMYYRGNELSTGNGLGLYMVRKLLKSVNGNIKVDSIEDEYTIFTINLCY